jgi:pimeloyl-ACP methyl ester carboxylesterase
MASDAAQRVVVTTADGRRLDVLVSGPIEASALVVHSGIPTGLVALPSQLDPAAHGVRTVLYARPGYIRSTPHPERTVADAAKDTAAIVDALGIDTFINLGWSGGGPHALACAAPLADRCLATAVVAGFSPFPNDVWPPDSFPLTRQGGEALAVGLLFPEIIDDLVARAHH